MIAVILGHRQCHHSIERIDYYSLTTSPSPKYSRMVYIFCTVPVFFITRYLFSFSKYRSFCDKFRAFPRLYVIWSSAGQRSPWSQYLRRACTQRDATPRNTFRQREWQLSGRRLQSARRAGRSIDSDVWCCFHHPRRLDDSRDACHAAWHSGSDVPPGVHAARTNGPVNR